MKFLKWLFGRREPAMNKPVVEHSDFSVEFYPLTNRYYPKYKDYYLKTCWSTGIVETREGYLFAYADYGTTEEEADDIIRRFKEQWLKENVRTIQK